MDTIAPLITQWSMLIYKTTATMKIILCFQYPCYFYPKTQQTIDSAFAANFRMLRKREIFEKYSVNRFTIQIL